MTYRIQYTPRAERDLAALEQGNRRRIHAKIEALAANPRPPGSLKLAGASGWWRLRVGDYRIVYEIHDEVLIVSVIKVAHRKDSYRGL